MYFMLIFFMLQYYAVLIPHLYRTADFKRHPDQKRHLYKRCQDGDNPEMPMLCFVAEAEHTAPKSRAAAAQCQQKETFFGYAPFLMPSCAFVDGAHGKG